MSWAIAVSDCPRDEAKARLIAARDEEFSKSHWQSEEAQTRLTESRNDATLGIEAALLLLDGGATPGAIGTDGPVTISISGHSNTDHGKVSGWANEMVTVSVSEV